MATDGKEGFGEKVKEFFTQKPEDHKYEQEGGDARVPVADRKGKPLHEANAYAAAHGEDLPYPELANESEPGARDTVDPENVVVEERPDDV